MRAILIGLGAAAAVAVIAVVLLRPAPDVPNPPVLTTADPVPTIQPPTAVAPVPPVQAAAAPQAPTTLTPAPAPPIAQATPPAAAAAPQESPPAEFGRLVAAGQGALTRVETFPNDGQNHQPVGTPLRYRTDPPVAGDHWPVWADPGRYAQAPPNEALVHSLEHGHIVIYIDRPNADGVRLLTVWSNMYRGMWDGIVVVPRANLGGGVVLTAWQKVLRLNEFDPAAAAAFIDQFRGRGPENPVR